MIDPRQIDNISTLITDLLSIYSNSDVTPEDLQVLKTDVTKLLNDSLDDAAVNTLEEDIQKMIDAGTIDIALLKSDLTHVVDTMTIPPPWDKAKVKRDLLKIKEDAHLEGKILDDLQVIVTTAQENHQTRRRHA